MRAWLIVTPVGIVATLLAGLSDVTRFSTLALLCIGAIAQLPLGLVLLAGGRIADRVRWRRTAVVVVTLVAGAARGITIAALADAPDPLVRTFASAITMSIWLQVVGAVLASHEHYRREVDELLDVLVARELQGRLLDDDVTSRAQAESTQRIDATSSAIRAIVSGATEDHLRTAALLQSAIETRLRPLSHDLWFSPAPMPPRSAGPRTVIRRILQAPVPALPMTGAAIVLLAWGSLALHGVWSGSLVGIAVASVYGLVLAAANGVRSNPAAAALLRYGGGAALPALAGLVVISAAGLAHGRSVIAVALGLPLITLGVAAARTLGEDRAATVADLRARLAEPDWDRHLGELVRRHLDVHAASALHNSLQPALMAASLQLQLAASLDDRERARDALDRASRALDAVAAPRTPSSGRERLGELAVAWAGIAQVRLTLPDGDLTAREWALLADVIDESIANAVRHGHARVVDVQITAAPDVLVIEMADDGEVPDAARSPGMGTTWLSTVLASNPPTVVVAGRRTVRMEVCRTAP